MQLSDYEYYREPAGVIYCGDCLEILPLIEPGSVDLVLTDPPYNIGYKYESYKDSIPEEDYKLLIGIFSPYKSVFIHYPEMIPFISNALDEYPQKIVAWVYNSNMPRNWRAIAWFGIKPDFNLMTQPYKNCDDKRIREYIKNGKSARLYEWWFVNQVKNVSNEKTEHSCQIPLEVMSRILSITPSNLILDPFLGSGTTAVAAKQLGRKFIGIEIEEKYCAIAKERLAQEELFK